MLNHDIPFPKVFVTDEDGTKIGVLSKAEAIELAKSQKKDLVLISMVDNKPITRILDYGKFKYNRKKKAKEAKEKQSVTVNREVRLTVNIGDHDLNTKARKAREFILNGDRVKVSLKFRGREMMRPEIGQEVIQKFYACVEDIAKISKEATLINDRFLDMYLEKDKKKVQILEKQTKEQGDNDAKNEN
ncbi:translation initiation factor IF-3 [Mycoplasma phocoenae]|uniref:Translation initiation factor IF-3 n=1 Tax=Mycoplasma phocoenae TaxID=754517 RepID=A0A858U2B0_9MOLU|nr:translation initiation factor IF-3 [Mycoplasma phocoenae]QJG67284.1 translation initiation factor IF-3 [Mycoplasma phocoenae]